MAYNGTLVGSPNVTSTAASFSSTRNAANFGNCLAVNGTSQCVTFAKEALQFTVGASWTVRGRFRSTSSTGTQVIIGLRSNDASPPPVTAWWVGTVSGVLKASISGFNTGTPFGTASVSDSNWHDFKLEVTTGSSAVLTVDGAAAGSQTGTFPTTATQDNAASVGAYFSTNPSSFFYFVGQIDHVSVWDNVSSGAEPTSPYAGTESGLRALWHFDSNANDSKAATTVTFAGPTTGVSGIASTNFTVGANGAITGTVVVTPSDASNGGTFTPTTVSISSGSPTGTFTYTPASTGTKTISVTNNGSLSNPSNISYVSSAAAKYTLVDTTDGLTGQNIRILVPNSNAAIPYNAANPTGVIMYHHGVGESQTALLSDSLKATCVDAFLDAGYILCGSNANGENFGSQAAINSYSALDKYVRANYNVLGVLIWSQSMGGLSGALSLTQNKIAGVVGWLGTYPLINLAAAYAGTGGTNFSSSINTAFGITGSGIYTYANQTYGLDAALKPGNKFGNVPMRFYASASDVTVGKTQNTDVLKALVADYCRESTVVVCTGVHGDTSHFVPSEYVAFAQRCFADPVTGYSEPVPARRTRPIAMQKRRW